MNSKGSRVRIVITTPKGSIIEQSFTLGFHATNKEIKYETIVDLKMVVTLGVTGFITDGESDQRGVHCQERANGAIPTLVLSLRSTFFRCDFKQISRSENNHTDFLANLRSAVEHQFRREIPVEHIAKTSIHPPA